MTRAYLGLGSNLGDRMEFLKEALRSIDQQREIEVTNVSSVYETEPIGKVDQPSFLNCVAVIETGLAPRELLEVTSRIELELKREREVRWGPRTIDIDILLFDDLVVDETDLVIPHPRLCERAFAVVPLMELSSDIVIPGVGKASECLECITGQGINKLAALDIGDIINK